MKIKSKLTDMFTFKRSIVWFRFYLLFVVAFVVVIVAILINSVYKKTFLIAFFLLQLPTMPTTTTKTSIVLQNF